MAQEKVLTLFSQTEYQEKAPNGHPVTCPTLDLSATWDEASKNLFVYRPPAQVVLKIHQLSTPGHKPPSTQTLTWKPDGHFLAVGWSDGVVRLMGLENNKAAHSTKVCESPETKITHIAWATNATVDSSIMDSYHVINQVWSKMKDTSNHEDDINLPSLLTYFDVDTSLPKISPLPSASAGAGEDSIVFTLRSGIDFLFRDPQSQRYDMLDVMVIGTSDSKLQLTIHDSFSIGTFSCPKLGSSGNSLLIHHTSHPHVSTHALLLAEKTEEPEEVHLVAMDLPFIPSSPINLTLLTYKMTTLAKLLRYLKQTQLHMQVEWKNTRELPTRFLRSVEGDLENMTIGPRSIVPALCHTLATGHSYRPVREWLVDSLAERGHKRWDKAVVSGLESLRSLVHQNYLPALERCLIVLSRLKGLAEFHGYRADVGLTELQITRVIDIIRCLSLVGHKILDKVMDELDHFASFSTWLRFQIDRLASSTISHDLNEKEATIDHRKVLTYITSYLVESPLKLFLDDIQSEDYTKDWAYIEDGLSLVGILKAQLEKNENRRGHMKALPKVEFLVKYMDMWCNRIFTSTADAKKKSVRFGDPVKLSIGHAIDKIDVQMCTIKSKAVPESKVPQNPEVNVVTALSSKETNNQVYIFCAGVSITKGISNNHALTACYIDLGSQTLINFKFLNDKTLVVLYKTQGNIPKVLYVPIQPDRLPYGPYDPAKPSEMSRISIENLAVYSFPETPILRPLRMEVHDRSDIRGEVPARICLLESNGTTLRTYKLPAAEA